MIDAHISACISEDQIYRIYSFVHPGCDWLIGHYNSSSHSEQSRGAETCCRVNHPSVYCKYHTEVWREKKDIQYTICLKHEVGLY